MRSRQKPLLERLAGLDRRSLGAFRIGLALVLLSDLIRRATNLTAHYSDAGVLPRTVLIDWQGPDGPWSFHLLAGSPFAQGLLFALAGLAALAMLCGYRTRWAVFLSWLFLCSLHGRNPAILHDGDSLLRVLLFWSMFVPLGEAFAVDSGRSRCSSKETAVSAGTVALMLQLVSLYLFAGLLKWDPAWTQDGIAVYQALSFDQLAAPFGASLLAYPGLLKAATFATLGLELLGPLLVFVPWRTGTFRMFAVVLFTGFHLLGLGLTFYLGNFPWVCAAAWLMFLPSGFWDAVGQGWRSGLSTSRLSVGDELPSTGFARLGLGVAVAGLSVLTLLWNVRTLDPERHANLLPSSLDSLVYGLRLDQHWNLFAPYPSLDDGWYVMPGQLADGTEINAFTGGPVSWEKPAVVSRHLGPERWKKFFMNLWSHNHAPLRRSYARWLCDQWQEAPEPLERFQIFYVLEWTEVPGFPPPGGEPLPEEPQRHLLYTQICISSRQ